MTLIMKPICILVQLFKQRDKNIINLMLFFFYLFESIFSHNVPKYASTHALDIISH